MPMTSRTASRLALIACSLLGAVAPARSASAGLPTIKLRANRTAILNDGKDVSEIVADVRDSTGNFVPNGTSVRFTTDKGGFQPGFQPDVSVTTQSGQARVRLVGQQKGTAKILASMQGAVSDTLEITLTDDPSETFQGNAYVDISGTKSLLYSANERVIEATGIKRDENEKGEKGLPGAILTYRNIEIAADTLQLSCNDNVVKANGHVVLTRGGKRLQCL